MEEEIIFTWIFFSIYGNLSMGCICIYMYACVVYIWFVWDWVGLNLGGMGPDGWFISAPDRHETDV